MRVRIKARMMTSVTVNIDSRRVMVRVGVIVRE